MSEILICGAGAFGTALAIALARDGSSVALWGRNPDLSDDMQRERRNRAYLPDTAFPDSLEVVPGLGASTAETVLLAIPTQVLDGFLAKNAANIPRAALVACCKGVDLRTGRGPTAVIAAHCPESTLAVLSGPSFAVDLAQGLPTALTLACADGAAGLRLQTQLSRRDLRLYLTDDVVGTELGGALKNVIALAAGMTLGSGLGESARAAVVTRGFAEMRRVAEALGAKPETLVGLSGLGDLFLTATSEKSRNYSAGLALGAGRSVEPGRTVEGLATARAVAGIAGDKGIEAPLTRMVAAVSEGRLSIEAAMDDLLSRPLRRE